MSSTTDKELRLIWDQAGTIDESLRAVYERGRSDERADAGSRGHWPKPIADRRVTERDGNKLGLVQYVEEDSALWRVGHWMMVDTARLPWHHTPDWEPQPPTLQEQALEVLSGLEKRFNPQCDLSLIRKALEASQ